MRAAILRSYNSPLERDDVEPPLLSSSEGVILRVLAAGVCHSDLHLIDGKLQSMPINLPLIPGHELRPNFGARPRCSKRSISGRRSGACFWRMGMRYVP